jgi:putative ABC transport system permease protein
MRRPMGLSLARGLARLLALLYPSAFRRAHGESFPLVAEDRWRRERAAGASAGAATRSTIRVLVADTWSGRRALRRGRIAGPPRRPILFDRFLAQIRYAARGLVRAPLLTLVATVSLAIGIGANTAIFTVANAVLFAPASGIDHFDRLVDIGRTTRGTGFDTLSYPTYVHLRDHSTTLAGVIALRPDPTPLSVGATGDAVLAYGQLVSANYFDVLGVRPAAGGLFERRDEHPGTPFRLAVLSYGFWRRQFAGDTTIVGTNLVLNGDTYTVAGVAAAGFQGTTIVSPDVWLPLTALARTTPDQNLLQSRGSLWLELSARLAPGATIDQARGEMTALSRGLAEAYPDTCQGCGLAVAPSRRIPADLPVVPFFAMLLGLVGVVLVVTCANLSGLLVARAGTRARELAVRLALGASRGSLVAMFLVESLVLFLPGAALALVVANGVTHLIESLTPRLPVPVAAGLVFDWRVLAFTAGVTLAMALVTGLAPAWHATRGDLVIDLKRDASAPRRQSLRRVFVTAQLAFCLVSMALAGLLLRSLHATTTISPGFQVDRIDVASVDLSLAGYGDDRAASVSEDLRARLAALPGIESVAAAAVVPLTDEYLGFGDLRRAGDPASASLFETGRNWSAISPGYLPTIGLPILRGRNFSTSDRTGGPRVAIVNERLARAAWPGLDPIGRVLETGDFRPGQEKTLERLEVVGVAADAKYGSIDETPVQFIYVPLSQRAWMRPYFFLQRSASAPSATPFEPVVRQTVRAFDRRLPLLAFAPLQQYADTDLLPQRIAASVAGSLGTLALALSAIGLYGLTAFLVSSRSREIGVRVALGAGHAHVIRLVVGEGMRLAVVGGAIGLCLSVGAARLLSSVLFGVSSLDPIAFGTAMIATTGVALVATYVPARRAATVDPLVALRTD